MARPQASFSKAGLYIPCLGGNAPKAWSASPERGLEAIPTVLTLMLKMGRRRPGSAEAEVPPRGGALLRGALLRNGRAGSGACGGACRCGLGRFGRRWFADV